MFAEKHKIEKDLTNPGQATIKWKEQTGLLHGILATLGLIAAIHILSATAFYIPNAGVGCMLAVAYAAYTGGTRSGLISAALSFGYVAWVFSLPGEPIHFDEFNRHRLVVLAVAACGMAFLVGTLKHRSRLYKETMLANTALQAQLAERSKVEESLRLAATVFESAREGIMVTDADNIIRTINPAFTQITGYTAAEAVGNDPRLLSSGLQDDAFYQAMWASIKGAGHWQGELRNRRKNGEIFCEWLSISTIADATGGIIRHVGIFTDITEQKKTLEVLLENRERLWRSQAYANIGSWDRNIQTGDVYWSERIGPLLGYAEGEVEATYPNFLNAVHPEDRQYVMDSANACVNGGGDYNIEHRVIWPDGTVHWLQQRGNVIRGDDGSALRMLGVAQDITDRKQAEEALRESETRFRQLAENIHEVFWIRDIINDRVLYVSPAYEHVWGRKLGSFDEAYRSFRESIHPEDCPRLFSSMQDEVIDAVVNEYRIVRPDGAVRWVRSRASPIRNESGQVFRVVGVAEDITDIKQAQEERLAQAIKQRDTLVREVHHRIKNNLQAVAGLLMRETHAHPELEPLLMKPFAQVQLIGVIHGIQAGVAAGEIFLCKMTLAIARLVESLTQSRIQVDVKIEMPSPVKIVENESVTVALILNELLVNAVKHSPNDAQTKSVEVTITRDGEIVQVRIFNAGALPRWFDYASRIGTATGLELVRSLMPCEGAELSFRSLSNGVETVLKLGAPVIYV